MRNLLRRSRMLLISATLGGAFVLNGCDPTVRDTVLNGVGGAATGLANTFIQAFIESLIVQGQETATTI
jgi:hypothetical protein